MSWDTVWSKGESAPGALSPGVYEITAEGSTTIINAISSAVNVLGLIGRKVALTGIPGRGDITFDLVDLRSRSLGTDTAELTIQVGINSAWSTILSIVDGISELARKVLGIVGKVNIVKLTKYVAGGVVGTAAVGSLFWLAIIGAVIWLVYKLIGESGKTARVVVPATAPAVAKAL